MLYINFWERRFIFISNKSPTILHLYTKQERKNEKHQKVSGENTKSITTQYQCDPCPQLHQLAWCGLERHNGAASNVIVTSQNANKYY